MEPQKVREYWPSLIMAIRHDRQWSQSTLASEVDSSQETVSRWESGAVIPSRQKQNRIEQIAEGVNISSLGGISNIVRLTRIIRLGDDLGLADVA